MTRTDAIEHGSASSGAAGRPAPPRGLLWRGPGRLGGLLLCVAVAAAVSVLSLAVGSRTVPLDATLGALTSYDASDQAQLIVREVRGPRTLIGLMAVWRSGSPGRSCRA
jgi:iron complex transport system permease protein